MVHIQIYLCVSNIIDRAHHSNITDSDSSRTLDPGVTDLINHLSLLAFLHVGKLSVISRDADRCTV